MPLVMPTTPAVLANATRRAKALLSRWRERVAEGRRRKVRFEMEMYRGLHRYSSKNDDDLPLVR